MSTYQQFRLVDDTPKSRMGRMFNSIRSYWKGPYTLSTITSSLFGDSPTASAGVSVSEQTALTYSAFWACVNAIATDVASLPLIHYKRDSGGGKTRYTDSKLYRILHDEPNPEMTSFTFRQTVTAHALTWGGGYAEIERDVQNRPHALWLLTPDRVQPYRTEADTIAYKVKRSNGDYNDISAGDMLHIPGLGFNGTVGYSVVGMARESIGLGLATEKFGGTFFGNGATFGGVIAYKGPKPPAASEKNLDEVLAAKHQGVDKAHKLLALYNDATYTRMGIPPNDAQFLETRLHQIEEMCRWFRMPPHKIQHLLRATNNNIEHQGIEYYTDTLRPWLVRWEQEINRKLIAPVERRIQFTEHLIDGVLRGDLPSRYAAYAVGRNWGWLSADDIRERENMNPLPNGQGKIYLLPLNMTPADRISELVDAEIAAKTKPAAAPVASADPAVQKNALEMVDAIRVALTETQEKAEGHLARAVAAEAAATQATDGGAVLRVEAETERAAALELAREVGTLKALLVEATDREAGERAARELADEDALTARAAEAAAVAHATAVQAEKEAAVGAARLTLAQREQALLDAETRLEERDGWLPPADVATDKAEIVATHEAAMTRLVMDVDTRERERDAAICAVRQAEARAGEQAIALANAAEELASQQDSEQKRLVAVIGAHRSLIVDAMGRMIRRETEKARRAQATPEKLRAWIASFYPVHDEICRAALLPAIRAHVAWTQSGDDPAIVTSGFVRQHIEESIRQLLAVLDSDPEDYAETLETTLRRWELERSDVLADVILQEAVGYVGQR